MEMIQPTGKDIHINLKGVRICCDDFVKGGVPVIFIHGFPFDKSSWHPQMEFLNRKIANSELHEINNAGHLSNLEQPDKFNSFLAPFISKW